MSRYTVTAQRTAKWWVLQAVEAPGAISQVARLDQADQIKEAIAFVTGEAEADIVYDLRPVGFEETIHVLKQLRDDAERAAAEAQRATEETARTLVGEGLSYRDAATLMGVSFQRVGQIVGRPRVDAGAS